MNDNKKEDLKDLSKSILRIISGQFKEIDFYPETPSQDVTKAIPLSTGINFTSSTTMAFTEMQEIAEKRGIKRFSFEGELSPTKLKGKIEMEFETTFKRVRLLTDVNETKKEE
jgi:hypothetical protein